jgi:hydroxymethylbilane synthase
MKKKIIIGSRGSELALWQANHIKKLLTAIGLESEIKIIKTKGDRIQNISFDKIEGKGFFTKEIEDALINKEIDLAVHSHKDLPTCVPEELVIAAVSKREDPSEVLLVHGHAFDPKQKFSIKPNAITGTSSARRKSQLLAYRPDLILKDLRGNVTTRIQKLRDKQYDAILIAQAGVSRLEIDLSEFYTEKLNPNEFIPAPAQGVLALQIRKKDKYLFEILQKINEKEVSEIIGIEREILHLFEGGCQLPLGVYCSIEENKEEEKFYKLRLAIALNARTPPKYYYFESKKHEGLAQKVVEKIKNQKNAGSETKVSVFISRDFKRNDFFKNVLEANGYMVFAQSLIEIKPIPIKKAVTVDWVFFSSKNAVKHFFEQSEQMQLRHLKIGAVGKATADEIRKYNRRADFIGDSNNTVFTGKKFSAMVGSKKVLFPQAKSSMKTIQFQLKKDQVIDLIVYETIKKNKNIPAADIIVFTSPSNVDAFFETNRINEKQKVVAMGDATVNALKKYGINSNKMPISFDDLGLVQAVFSLR